MNPEEKWVVVQCFSDWSGAEKVYGLFSSKASAEDFKEGLGWFKDYCQVFRVRNWEIWA